MTTTSPNSKIKDLSSSLLDPTITDEQAAGVLNEIHQLYESLIGLSGKEETVHQNAAVDTTFGKALGLTHAARCLIDYKRTQALLKAVVSGIREKQAKFPGEQINIFYAGCGPYAPFVTLVAPLFEPSEVRFSILEVNAEALQYATSLIEELELAAYIENCFQGDAITSVVPDPDKYHILFSETLDALLYRECYVPILCNLIPQFSDEVIVIPENVQIKMSFIRADENGAESEDEPVVVFDTREIVEASKKMDQLPDSFEPTRVPIDRESNIVAIVLDTEIHVGKDLKLFRDESALTRPYAFDIDPETPFNTFAFTYFLKPQIELFTGTE